MSSYGFYKKIKNHFGCLYIRTTVIVIGSTSVNAITNRFRSLAKSSTIPPTLHHNSTIADSDLDKANICNNYFYSVFTQISTNQLLPTGNLNHLPHISITEEDVYNALINLDTSKAMGPDGISPIVLSKCAL